MPEMTKQIGLIMLLAGFLGACAQTTPSVSSNGISPATPDPSLPLPPEPTRPAFEDVIEEPSGRAVDPQRLLGQSPDHVQGLLGIPGLVRRDGGVQVMLYDQGPCIFDVTFISRRIGQGFAAHHIAARDHKGEDVDTATCLSALLESRPLTTEQWQLIAPLASPALEGESPLNPITTGVK